MKFVDFAAIAAAAWAAQYLLFCTAGFFGGRGVTVGPTPLTVFSLSSLGVAWLVLRMGVL